MNWSDGFMIRIGDIISAYFFFPLTRDNAKNQFNKAQIDESEIQINLFRITRRYSTYWHDSKICDIHIGGSQSVD